MFGTVCDGTDGGLMAVMAVMGALAMHVNAFLGALFATVCQDQLLTSGVSMAHPSILGQFRGGKGCQTLEKYKQDIFPSLEYLSE